MRYAIKLPIDHRHNPLITPVALIIGETGYSIWDDVKYKVDNIIKGMPEEVIDSWIGASMFGWDTPVAAKAMEYAIHASRMAKAARG